jgi:hypothetical protein
MITSGETAVSTSGDTSVALLTFPAAGSTTSERHGELNIINEGAAAGFFSIDGEVTWARLPAASAVRVDLSKKPIAGGTVVKVKRIASGTNLATVYAWAH